MWLWTASAYDPDTGTFGIEISKVQEIFGAQNVYGNRTCHDTIRGGQSNICQRQMKIPHFAG